MNFCELNLPTPKPFSANCGLKPFPVDAIPEKCDEFQFLGIFNGLSVDVTDQNAIKRIYSDGCFGLSAKTKNMPQALMRFSQKKVMSHELYQQKLALANKLQAKTASVNCMERNDDLVKNSDDCRTIEDTDGNDTEAMEVTETNEGQDLQFVADPFPIEEVLALLPEEAFFLHFSLRCLKVINFDQTHEYTTEELFGKFYSMNPQFIQRYIVYHYYRSKNWVVKSGLKFGGDFLLYYKGPSYYHASYVVVVNDYEDDSNHLDMQSNYRVADSTNKEMILASVTRPDNLEYSNWKECLAKIQEFKITEIIPKRFMLNQLNTNQSKS